MMYGIFLLLGTNLGEKALNLALAIQEISKIGAITKTSSIYETAAWGKKDQPSFYNQVIEIETTLPPRQLLEKVLSIELALGRKREEKWGARTLDIDILFYSNQIINEQDLTIPHPLTPERRFVLEPLNEIAPLLLHPVLKTTVRHLLETCSDPLLVKRIVSSPTD